MTQMCRILIKALWRSWMLGRHLSRSDLMTSLRCGWLFVIAGMNLQQQKTKFDDGGLKSAAIPHLYIENIGIRIFSLHGCS